MTIFSHLLSTGRRATFLRFTAGAAIVAAIDILLLYLLHGALGVNVYLGRVVSYPTAITVGYFLHQHFTFHHHKRKDSILSELVRFYMVFTGGGIVNYATFSAIVAIGDAVELSPTLRFWLPLLAVWIGGIAGMVFNYGFAQKKVFHNR